MSHLKKKSNSETLTNAEKIIALQKQLYNSNKKIKLKEKSCVNLKKLWRSAVYDLEVNKFKAEKASNDCREQMKIADLFMTLYSQSLELVRQKASMYHNLLTDKDYSNLPVKFSEIECELNKINEHLRDMNDVIASIKMIVESKHDLTSKQSLADALEQMN